MRTLTAKDVMNSNVLSVRDDLSLAALAEFLVDNEISGAPVEDVEGRLVGVVSLTDLATWEMDRAVAVPEHSQPDYYLRGWEERWNPEDLVGLRVGEAERTVGEIMTPSVLAIDEESTIPQVAKKMIDARVHRLLVTRQRRVVGIVTTTDLLGLLVDEDEDARAAS
jgi:CBS domain-containing protein